MCPRSNMYKTGQIGRMIHPTANIYETAKIGEGTKIGAFAEIGYQVQVGKNCSIGCAAFIPENICWLLLCPWLAHRV